MIGAHGAIEIDQLKLGSSGIDNGWLEPRGKTGQQKSGLKAARGFFQLTREKHHQLEAIRGDGSEDVTVKKCRLFSIDCPDGQGSFTPWIFAPWMLSELLQVPV
jgi:hypothetical protein